MESSSSDILNDLKVILCWRLLLVYVSVDGNRTSQEMRAQLADQTKGLTGTDTSGRVATKVPKVVHINSCAVGDFYNKVEAFAEKTVEFLQEEYDDRCVKAVLHMDEQVRDLSETEKAEALIASTPFH